MHPRAPNWPLAPSPWSSLGMRAPLTGLARRPPAPLMRQTDDQCLVGDAAVGLLYGVVQQTVDTAFAPIAEEAPQLLSEPDPLPYPALQGMILAITWVACSQILNLYNVDFTRGSALDASVACVSSWVTSVIVLSVGVWLLSETVHLGPGLSSGEVSFYTGSLSVVAAWRWLVWRMGGNM